MALLTIQFYHAIRFTCGENKGGNLKLKNRYSLITTIILRHTERIFCYTTIISKVIWTDVSDFQFHELAISAIRGDCLKFIARPRGICLNVHTTNYEGKTFSSKDIHRCVHYLRLSCLLSLSSNS